MPILFRFLAVYGYFFNFILLFCRRGSLLSTAIFVYAATSPVNGYFGGSLYARMGGKVHLEIWVHWWLLNWNIPGRMELSPEYLPVSKLITSILLPTWKNSYSTNRQTKKVLLSQGEFILEQLISQYVDHWYHSHKIFQILKMNFKSCLTCGILEILIIDRLKWNKILRHGTISN